MKSKVTDKVMRAVPLFPNSLVLFGYNRLKKSISAKRIEEHYQNNTDKLKAFIRAHSEVMIPSLSLLIVFLRWCTLFLARKPRMLSMWRNCSFVMCIVSMDCRHL